jgi:glutaminase
MKIIDSNSLFRSLDQSNCGAISASDILQVLAQSGIAIGDARLAQLRKRLKSLNGESIDEKGFDSLQDAAGQLLARAQKGELIIPDFANFSAKVEKIFARVVAIGDGKVADYIPQLARISGDRFAVSMCTIDGQSLQLGDADEAFTLQSSCKPVLYCAALEELGEQNVHKHVGREPSGLSFNELSLNASGLPTTR